MIKYDISEYVDGIFYNPFNGKNIEIRTSMGINFKGAAEFSIGKGKWIAYNAFYSVKSTGFMNSNTDQEFKLVAE